MDPLSDVLSLLKLHRFWSAGLDFGGEWSVAFEPYEGIKFYAAISGECWLTVDGVAQPIRVVAGDCLVLPRGRAFRVASDLSLEPAYPRAVNPKVADGSVISFNGGGDFFCLAGEFALAGDGAHVLVDLLPPIVHIYREPDKAVLRWCVDQMRQELRDPQPGGFLIAQQLATMILVQALRLYLEEGAEGGVGWLFALADEQIAAAISAMHEDPAGRWTVEALAKRADMSRTAFTLKFKATVGVAPIEYLTRWRMMVAASRLRTSSDPINEIAQSLGYDSESAFGAAFKRIVGFSPRQYGRAE